MKDDDKIQAYLHQAKLRHTPVRSGVLEVLSKSPRPLGAVDILGKLPPHTDAVTVYRTLNTLTKKKILHRIRGEDRVWRYAMDDQQAATPHQHPHFVCEDCGKVECLNESIIPPSLIESLHITGPKTPKSNTPGYQVSYAEVVLHGHCPKCR